MSMRLKQLISTQGIATIEPLYSQQTIEEWNTLFSSIFDKQSTKRRYVSAFDLMENNLLNQIFNEELRALIFSLIPDATLYHCHAYEIAPEQTKPHISADNYLDGWHRDVDCKHQLKGEYIQHISLFVYLSDVESNGGYFEVSNKRLYPPQFGNQDTHYQLIGNTGTCFLFDRKAYHRASTNYSKTPRRVLKLSFQSRALFNHKHLEPIFRKVCDTIPPSDKQLRQLFGDLQHELDDSLIASYAKQGYLPIHQSKSNFSTYQNSLRYIRDLKFLTKRIAAGLNLVKDSQVPKQKVT